MIKIINKQKMIKLKTFKIKQIIKIKKYKTCKKNYKLIQLNKEK